MDTTDKNIKEAFSTYTKSFDIDLEESIMDKVNVEKNYSTEILQARKGIKKGIVSSTLFLTGYFLLTYFDTIPRITKQTEEIDVYLPAMFAALLIVIMYFLLSYGISSTRNKLST